LFVFQALSSFVNLRYTLNYLRDKFVEQSGERISSDKFADILKIDSEKLAEINPADIKAATDRFSAKFSGSPVVSQKPSEKVDVDLQCPFCGCAKRWKVPSYFKFMNCPDCQGSIFLSWATEVKGELDENGFYFRGDSPMKFKEQTDEFEDMFAIEESK